MTLSSLPRIRNRNEPLETSQGDHICLIYDEEPGECLDLLVPFMRQGLSRGERCVYVAAEETLHVVRRRLEVLGLDLEVETERQALLLWTPEQWRHPEDTASIRRVGHIWTYVQNALEAGFAGVRFVVDKSWYEDPDIDTARIREWEATIDAVFTPDIPARLVCQYGRHRLSPSILEAGLCTHPIVLLDNQAGPNPYYDAPLLLQSESAMYLPNVASSRTDWMLDRLRLLHEFKPLYPGWQSLGK
jgi:hypothetical protein